MRNYLLYLVLFSLLALLAVLEPQSSQWFMYDRQLIEAGQVWRLFTAHFVHLSLPHLAGNLMGVALLAYIAGRYLNNALGLALLFWCVLVVGLGLFLYADYLQRYVGLSGVLHGLLLVAPFISRHYSQRIAWVFLAIILIKVIWEQSPLYDDMALHSTIGGRVEANAHLLGVLAGLLFLAGYYAQGYFVAKSKKQALKNSDKGS
jgi:rhomboid family GlyGly-CTERM serine protease